MSRWCFALVLCLAGLARATEVRPGLGVGLGAFIGTPAAPLVSPRFDVQVEGGDRTVAFFVAARFGTFAFSQRSSLFVPTIEAGARWHVHRRITVGLAVAGAVAVPFAPDAAAVFLVGATLEPFTWSFTAHHELGIAIGGLLLAGGPPPVASGPFFSALLLPTVGYTYRF